MEADVAKCVADVDGLIADGQWSECISLCERIKGIVEHEQLPLRVWLDVSRRQMYALGRLRRLNEIISCRRDVFSKLGGNDDLYVVLGKRYGIRKDGCAVNTSFRSAGRSNFYACKHVVKTEDLTERIRIFEKCQGSHVREAGAYRYMERYDVLTDGAFARTPDLLGAVEADVYEKIFLEHVRGRRARLACLDYSQFGAALAEVSLSRDPKRFRRLNASGESNSSEYAGKPVKALGRFDVEQAKNVFRGRLGVQLDQCVAAIRDLLCARNRVEKVRQEMIGGFCHNDIGSGNVLVSEEGGPPYIFLDWANAGFNALGSDIGDVLGWPDFVALDSKGERDLIEAKIRSGYASQLANCGCFVTDEEIRISCSIHFLRKKLSTALRERNFNLFCQVGEKARWLRQVI